MKIHLLVLVFPVYASNPIIEELGKLDIEGLFKHQQYRDQIEIDLYFKKQKDKEEKHQQKFDNKSKQRWNKSEKTILKAKKRFQVLQNKLSAEGNWGKVKLDIDDLKEKKPSVNLKYRYGF